MSGRGGGGGGSSTAGWNAEALQHPQGRGITRTRALEGLQQVLKAFNNANRAESGETDPLRHFSIETTLHALLPDGGVVAPGRGKFSLPTCCRGSIA